MITMSGLRSFQHLVLFVVIISFNVEQIVAGSYSSVRCKEEERDALLVFKQGLVDERDLSSWVSEDNMKDCCKWSGVQCSNQTGHVNGLQLSHLYFPAVTTLGSAISPLLGLHHLSYLDLSNNNFSGSRVPDFIGSFSKLKFLSLANAGLVGPVPHQLGNLSRLQFLDLGFNNLCNVGNLDWLSHLSSLRYLNLSGNNLDKWNDWFHVVDKLPSLTTLRLESCDLPPVIPLSVSHVNSTTSPVQVLDLSGNNFTSSIYPWLFNVSSNLVDLALDSNHLQGSIPDAFEQMVSLSRLSLSSNNLEGGVPHFFGNFCSLRALDLSFNNFGGQLCGFIQNLSGGCTETSLKLLSLAGNKFTGSVPDLTRFSSLKELILVENRLDGTISKSIGQMFKLEVLAFGWNSLEGIISEDFFSNLSNLHYLNLNDNSLALEFSDDWVPPFQLKFISLASCKMGPHFPKWLQTQKHFLVLDISNAGISDTVPDWFWDLSPQLHDLNISHNEIKGILPDLSLKFDLSFPGIDISSNHFEGPIPPLPSNASFLNFSKNKFSGPISFLCLVTGRVLLFLDLSSNLLSGRLPDCWTQFNSLAILNLANNGFSGNIPPSMGSLQKLLTLSLRNNSLSGGLTSSLRNCKQLRNLDLEKNALSGKIPAWIGQSLSNLVVLSLQSNRFHGAIPFHLCRLADIQILDLSLNNLVGAIPRCFNNFTAMTMERSFHSTISFHYYSIRGSRLYPRHSYLDNVLLTWKGSKREYQKTLACVKILDLSSNKLGGEVPEEIMSLAGLVALNLSRNNLSGQIPSKIGQLKLLDFLDLSRNHFFGEIPFSLSLIDDLSVLDLSHNNLWGKIPIGTQLQSFNASVYKGNNPGLCGPPLSNKCPHKQPAQGPSLSQGREAANTPEDKDQLITLGFYVSLVLGFILGFWGVCGTLLLNSSWRCAYFNFLTSRKDWLHVTAAATIAKLQRRLSN